jgi:hypothetical protein
LKEELLHFIWKFRLFNTSELVTTDGDEIWIHSTGHHNSNAGPDFLDARIQIGSETWVGHVEIHVLASDWNAHGHQHDEKYENVILHVVYKSNKLIYHSNPGDLPVLELCRIMDHAYESKYAHLIQSEKWVPCSTGIKRVNPTILETWKQRLVVSRLERKVTSVFNILESTTGDWNETTYRVLARNFGFNLNSDAFYRMAELVPYKLLLQHRDSAFQTQALVFGQAGFLSDVPKDDYHDKLKDEYLYLSSKLKLEPMNLSAWNKLRTRPSNFPEIRLSQFASLMYKMPEIRSALLRNHDKNQIMGILESKTSEYWECHSAFGIVSPKETRNLGEASRENIIINSIVPLLFAHGHYTGIENGSELCLALLESCKPELNKITRGWKKIGLSVENSGDSQALIELKNEFCAGKKCLNCHIGVQLLRS